MTAVSASSGSLQRRFATRPALAVLLGLALAACGGGGGGDGGSLPSDNGTPAAKGTRQFTSTGTSRITGSAYALSLYLPPASAGPRSTLPIVYLLDGESWFETLAGIVESRNAAVIVVGVHSAGVRSRDFVPSNNCTSGGGGHAAYFDFVRQELMPYVEGTFGGNPSQRALFGHSHGGAFVLYAMFAEAPGRHSFKAYLASDSSVSCMSATANVWQQNYAATYLDLPVRLHLSYATQGNYAANLEYAGALAQYRYPGFGLVSKAYVGSHGGIVPQVLGDAVEFAFAGSR